jgi:hypothetical protein
MTNFEKALSTLARAEVRFVIVGGYAVAAHGASYITFDLDICYERSRANLELLANALRPFHPRLRGAPDGLPFVLDAETMYRGMNFTLQTDLGEIDLLGEMTGAGGYEQATIGAYTIELHGESCLVAAPEFLVKAKRAAGRPKDLLAIPELEALIELKHGKQS